VCYPPFNIVSSHLLGQTVSDFPEFDDPNLHLAANLTLLALMAIYASASAALGLKASNLTHRGIICRGPYRVIRHPAYICKNMAWWIGSVPVIMAAFDVSVFDGIKAAGSMAAWSSVYALRALTEEDHLRRVDGAYAEYAAKVRYRFIPGVI
jgi:protein-S-isoprenylcysteine O-methyltransferase Ste14